MKSFTRTNILLSTAVLFILSMVLVSCQTDPCEDVICDPCENSKFIVRYEDSTGACDPALHAGVTVSAYDTSDAIFSSPAFTYDFSDSCTAGFIIDESLVYIVSGPGVGDTIQILEHDFQEPVEVTSCCLCHPVEHIDVSVNGNVSHVEFPAGAWQNEPFIRIVD